MGLPCVSVGGLAVEGQEDAAFVEAREKTVTSNLVKSLEGRTGQQDPVQTS